MFQQSIEMVRNKLIIGLSIPTPGSPHFYYILGANLGSLLHGDVFVMRFLIFIINKELKIVKDVSVFPIQIYFEYKYLYLNMNRYFSIQNTDICI